MILDKDTRDLSISRQKLPVRIKATSHKIVSKRIEFEQCFHPRLFVLFVIILAEQDMVPSFLFDKLWGKCVTNEASRQMLPNHSVQDVEF
jgi:hypothetical protein